jgi:glycosyltransferase involved in cell wall biosynthesis
MSTTVAAHSKTVGLISSSETPRIVQMVTYHFPPDREVGALRPAKVARSFLDRGHTVNVVAGPGELIAHDAGLSVTRVPSSLDLRALLRGVRSLEPSRLSSSSKAAPPAVAEENWVPPDRVPGWKRWISSLVWLPDDRQGWILPAARAAVRGIRAGASILYTSAPPHSVHIAGLFAKWRTGVFWVAEFRDPWTDNPYKPAFVRSRWSDAVERWFERRCIRSADLIVVVTDSFAERLRARFPKELHEKIVVIRNGIDRLEPPRPANEPHGAVELLYVGNLYHGRDPRLFFQALAALDREKRLPPGARVEFIGDCATFKGVPLATMLDEYGIRDRVVLRGRIPHAECLNRIAASDLLLLFAQDQPLQVPNKLYEYLGARHPIVAFVDPRGESERMLALAGGHFAISSGEPAHIEERLEAAFRAAQAPRTASPNPVVEQWTTDRQLAELHDALAARLP